jgi:large subunit ribosomal protein L27Ae
MRYFHKTQNKFHCPSINCDMIWSLLTEQSRDKYLAGKPLEKAPVIDVVQAGYHKVLGKGHLPKRPVIVKAKLFSKMAEKRIKEVGGACVLVA